MGRRPLPTVREAASPGTTTPSSGTASSETGLPQGQRADPRGAAGQPARPRAGLAVGCGRGPAYGSARPARCSSLRSSALGDTDGNPLTLADPRWLPLRPLTPAHQEYPSAHSTNTGAAAVVLAAFFGD